MLSIQIDDAQLKTMLTRLAQRIGNLRPVMQQAGNILRNDALDNFKGQHAPDGTPWKPLTLATRLARARRLYRSKGGLYTKSGKRTKAGVLSTITTAQALLDRGLLRNSIGKPGEGGIFDVQASSVTVGTRLPYAAIHQYGGTAGRSNKVRIPARPFIGLSTQARQQIVDTINRYIGTNQ